MKIIYVDVRFAEKSNVWEKLQRSMISMKKTLLIINIAINLFICKKKKCRSSLMAIRVFQYTFGIFKFARI